jgi:cytochrome c556
MKIRVLLCTLTLALAVSPGLRAQGGDDKEPQTELGGKMEKIGGAFRKLRNLVKDPTKSADALAQVAIIKENATAAAKLEPKLKETKPAADQAKFVADFQAKMKDFLADVGKLEDALKAGDNAAAQKLVDTLFSDEKDGHKAFRPPPKKQN